MGNLLIKRGAAWLLCFALVLSLCSVVSAAQDDTNTASLEGAIIILHTGDVHGSVEGYAKVAAMKSAYEALGAYVLLLDSGDFAQGDTAVEDTQGQAAVTLMNQAGYAAAALGGHELDYGAEALQSLLDAAEFSILAANVSWNGQSLTGSAVYTATDGTKIGVFGLSSPEVLSASAVDGLEVLSGEALYACAQSQVQALQAEGCTVIICLSHLGTASSASSSSSLDLLAHVSGIDLCLDGCAHATREVILMQTNGTGMVGSTVLTATGTGMQSIGISVIAGGQIATDTIPLEDITLSDSAVAEQAALFQAGLAAVFSDVERDGWYYAAVSYVYHNGIMNGMGDGLFGLEGSVSRQQLATILYRLAGSPAVSGDLSAYSDSSEVSSWAADAMVWAVQQGILTGTGEELLPKAAATRQQVATILYRYCGASPVSIQSSTITDAGQISAWAADAVAWAAAGSILTAESDGRIRPTDTMTRAEIAAALLAIAA